jgi:hypothetical protein
MTFLINGLSRNMHRGYANNAYTKKIALVQTYVLGILVFVCDISTL